MAFYLRFTDAAIEDLQRGTSYHNLSESDVEEMFEKYETRDIEGKEDSNGKQIVAWGGGEFSSVIGGLCGYELEAETIEEAIQEAKNGQYGFDYYGAPVIFEGIDTGIQNILGDGQIFKPVFIAAVIEAK